MKAPEREANLGEIYNLSISRGTLTEEDRYRINEHMAQTIVMLESLPWPRHLRRVPEYAGGHHEKMDGTGYPRGLKGEQMSIPARVMAIADIFEALTAADRPYKAPKKLSEALNIMCFMVKDRHIDPDLFRLFVRSGVYRQYATQHLNPEQIDDVDVEMILEKIGNSAAAGEDKTVSLAAWQKPAPAATEPVTSAAADLPVGPIRTESPDLQQLPAPFGGGRPHDVAPLIDEVDARV